MLGGLLVSGGLVIHAVNVYLGVPVDYQLLFAGLALILTIMFNPIGIAGVLVPGLARLPLGSRGRIGPATAVEPTRPASAGDAP